MKIVNDNPAANNLFSTLKREKDQNLSLKDKILKLDDKLQQMLLWSNISTLFACIILIFTIARLYSGFTDSSPLFLAFSLAGIVAAFGLLVFFVWKGCAYKDKGFAKASKTYLDYQVDRLAGQRKLVSAYLAIYTAIVVTSGFFFYADINNGLTVLLKVTVPLSVIIYGFGLYFIFSFSTQKKKLQALDKQANDMGFIEKIAGN